MASLERERVPSSRPVATREIQLIDRVEEMNLLREAVDRAVRGEGGLVLLHGEAGIGKTRLTRELGAYARVRGMRVLYGRCPALFKMDGVPPYILWNEVIKDYLEVCTPEQLYRVIGFYPGEVSKLVPELRQKLGAVPQSFAISPEQERDRLFEAVSQFVGNISRETPLLVVLDDLQWTDQSSLLLMHYLARGIYREPLLLLGAYRDADVDDKHPLSPVLTELNRERLLQSIPLKRMSLSDVSEMIRQILEQDEVPGEFCELVYEKTRGNPFFAEEVIKSLKEEGVIYREEDKWRIKEVSKIEFPKTVKDVIKNRINRLDDECQNVLMMASFVGNDFSFEALQGVTGLEENRLLEMMERLLKTGLIKEKVVRGEDVYSFADVIARDVLHEEVSHLRHKKLHISVGLALEKVYSEKIDERLGELAYHFIEGGDKTKALDYFLRAGEKAQEVYAHNEAFSYLQHALELLEEKRASPEEKVRVVERLGDLDLWMGKPDAALKHWNDALALWTQLEDKRNIAELHVKMAGVLWVGVGDKDKASEHHHVALEILQKEPESVELAGLYEDISHMLWRTGESGEALSWTQKALEVAERLGSSDVLAGCYNNLAVLSMKSGEFEKAAEYCKQGIKIALENKLAGRSLTLYNNLCNNYVATGEFQKLFETAQEGSEMAKKVGALYSLNWLDMMLMLSYGYMGDLQKALSLGEDILALVKRIKYTAFIPYVMGGLGTCYRWLGEWDKSLQYQMEALEIGKKVGEYQQSGGAASELGELFMEMGDYEEAERYLNESNSIFKKAGDKDSQFTGALRILLRLYLEKGEIDKAAELIEKISEYATKTKNRLYISDADMLKAMFSREQKNWEQSIQHFEKSLQEAKSLNAQKWHVFLYAEILYEYGLTYLKRNEENDKEKAFSLLAQALEIYQKTGARKRAEKVRSKMVRGETAHKAVPKSEPAREIPESVEGRVATGYTDLDRLLCGGIPRYYAVILTSPSCDERNLLIKSFLEAGTRQGEVTFYVAIDPCCVALKTGAEEFHPNFCLFVCNPQADSIVKSRPNVFKLKGVENLNEIGIALTSAIRRIDATIKGPRRICIEIISDVLLQHHAVQTRRWLTGLIPELRSAGFTTLAVMDPEMHSPQEVRAILDLFGGEINIREKEPGKGSGKYLKVRKMVDQKYMDNELLLSKENLQK